ncbi:carboxylic ester hydrolase-like [Periplaneta americana]|uniref:carboxylic ester hydrolase-like n=1 Tax=Periplaneta americana TaxID=6978 RepID=UPI0037E97F08
MTSHNIRIVVILFLMCTAIVEPNIFERIYSSGGCGYFQRKQVTAKQGSMRGSTYVSDNGRPFCGFRGIPFSQPPVGAYRFQPPRPPKPWTGVLDATEEAPMCIQTSRMPGLVNGQEDCLYMNIYTPYISPPRGKPMAVLVWIMQGNFVSGQISIDYITPHPYMDKDVVLVLFNYRVGAYGFLSTGDDVSPGNYGMKDQVAALRWVQDNIEAFGGNPNNVTIFGMSSGAASVHYHMISPLSKGLFHRAISFEGTALHPWARCPDPLQQAERQACILDCPIDNTTSLVACLREADTFNLTASTYNLYTWIMFPSSGYGPVIEKKSEGNPYPFLEEDPIDLLRMGKFSKVPWINGGTKNAGNLLTVPIHHLNPMSEQLIEYYDVITPKIMMMESSVNAEQRKNVTERIQNYYMGSTRQLNDESFDSYSAMITDRLFSYATYKSIKLHLEAGHSDIYQYNWAYRGINCYTMISSLKNYGAVHGDDFLYAFGLSPLQKMNGYDVELMDFFIAFVTNFAKYGHPTPNMTTGNYLTDELRWLPVVDPGSNLTRTRYLSIDRVITSPKHVTYLDQGLGPLRLQMKENLFQNRIEFMESLPIYENCLSDCESFLKPES